jgi:DNA mismatch repair protein MutL
VSEIKVLDEKIANKIAAGEVVDRPFNVVKELVENSLDANANFIRIDILDGGLSLIKVTDNGVGILPEDLKKSVLRYSTSKIDTIEDVYNIKTFGFRGEALAAISSVSDFSIESKRGDLEAKRLEVKFGQIGDLKPASLQEGTVVTVKNLFENVPVRKKFIKSINSEEREIIKFLKIFATINYNIEIELYSNDKKIITFTKYDNMLNRFISSFNIKDVFYFSHKNDKLFIEGIASSPTVQRNRRDLIFLGVNRRVIKDYTLQQAVVQAYFRKLPQNRFPAALISLRLDCDMLDVNVHPTKMAVKFTNDKEVFSFINKTISDKLNENEIETTETFKGSGFTETEIETKGYFTPDLFSNSVTDKNLKYVTIDTLLPEEKDSVSEKKYKIIGQLFDAVIIVQEGDEILFIDQHIAHERVLYEQFISMNENCVTSINLIEPVVVELEDEDKMVILENSATLSKLGFDIDDYGNEFISIRRIPATLLHKDVKAEFLELISELHNNKSENFLDKISLALSCKMAIKAGEKLTMYEMENIVEDLFNTKNRYTCPHGRPIIYKMSKEEIYKKFHRL